MELNKELLACTDSTPVKENIIFANNLNLKQNEYVKNCIINIRTSWVI